MSDTLLRFLFDDSDVRGELVQLDRCYQTAFQHIIYPQPLKHLLGEALSAAALMTATLKFTGKLSIQLQTDGALTLLLVQATQQQKIRGLVKWKGDSVPDNFSQLVDRGQFAITIEPEEGNRYQGIVPLDGSSFSECLEHYFIQSEQLPTRIWLAVNQEKAAGLLLQRLPGKCNQDGEGTTLDAKALNYWEHLTILANSISNDELLELPSTDVLRRLFHQENIRLFEHQPVKYECTCNRDRCENIIIGLGKEEIRQMMDKNEPTSMKCEFCSAEYTFNQKDLSRLLEMAE